MNTIIIIIVAIIVLAVIIFVNVSNNKDRKNLITPKSTEDLSQETQMDKERNRQKE